MRTRVNIVNITLETEESNHFCPNKEIICRKDENLEVLLFDIKCDGWCTSKVELWTTFENSQRWGSFRALSLTTSHASS